MHAIKGAWAGQTFALAKCNESEGRKSRIRRSKEERKTMVESFIKTYQSSNNGSFPSLNLTHKEVGGSFYTVREIVREVIQENRVLGPAKFSPEEQQLQNADQFLEQYPLGSLSYEPQISLTSSLNGTAFAFDHQSNGEEVVATTDELSSGSEHYDLNNGRIVNGSRVDTKSDDANNLRCVEFQVSEPSMNFEEETIVSEAKLNQLVSEHSEAKERLEDEMDASEAKLSLLVNEPSNAKESLEEQMVASEAKVSLLVSEPSEAKESLQEEMIASEAKVGESSEAKESLQEEIIVSEAKVTVSESSEAKESLQEEVIVSEAKVSEPSEAKESLQEEMIVSEAKVSASLEAKESLQEEVIVSEAKVNPLVREPSEAKENLKKGLAVSKAKADPLAADVIVEVFPVRPITKSTDSLGARSGEVRDATSTLEKTQVGMDRDALLENSNCRTTKEDIMHKSGIVAEVETINGEIKSKEAKAVVSDDKAETQPSIRSKKEATPTLDRINLKSWEDPSRTPDKNPLVAIFQSFMAAFMKLWSE